VVFAAGSSGNITGNQDIINVGSATSVVFYGTGDTVTEGHL
jgi:hypothetical protein